MKRLVSSLLAGAMLMLSPQEESKAVEILPVCIGIVVVGVGITIIIVVKESADCVSKARCPNCGAIRKKGDKVCPKCGEPYPKDAPVGGSNTVSYAMAPASFQLPPAAITNFNCLVQTSSDGENWHTIATLENQAPMVWYNPTTEFRHFETQEQFDQWRTNNSIAAEDCETFDISSNPLFLRYAETYN